jgi:DNA recombination protein RmuC
MEIILIIILALVFIALLVLIWLNVSKKEPVEKKDEIGLNLILQQINELNRTVDTKMSESARHMNESMRSQFSESSKLIKDVTEGLTKLDETNRQVVGFTDQLQSLQDILKNPKQRGILGEYYLETLLKNVLPPGSFEMQYKLGKDEEGNDLIPDAVVFVKEKIIPVDSKFSLENYNKIIEQKDPIEKEKLEKLFVNDLKNRITETSKYIQPAKGTMDFAFMFIPHEAIYYDLLINKIGALKEDTESLIQRAASKYKVIIVSPTSFLAYLQTVLQGLKAMQIEESAKDIVKRVGELTIHLKKYAEKYDKLGKSIVTVVNQYTEGSKEFKKIDKDIVRITEGEEALGFEPLAIDKPDMEE